MRLLCLRIALQNFLYIVLLFIKCTRPTVHFNSHIHVICVCVRDAKEKLNSFGKFQCSFSFPNVIGIRYTSHIILQFIIPEEVRTGKQTDGNTTSRTYKLRLVFIHLRKERMNSNILLEEITKKKYSI
jgi:hypothetical protein